MALTRRVAGRLTLRVRIMLALLVPALGAGLALTAWALDQRAEAESARDARERVDVIVAFTHVYDNVSFTREIVRMVSYLRGIERLPVDLSVLARGQVGVSRKTALSEMERARGVGGSSAAITGSVQRVQRAYHEFLASPAVDAGPSAVFSAKGSAAVESFRAILIAELHELRKGASSAHVAETAEMQLLADYRAIALRESSLVTLTAVRPTWTDPRVLAEVANQLAHVDTLMANQLSPDVRTRFLALSGTDGQGYVRLRDDIVIKHKSPSLITIVSAIARRDEAIARLEESIGVSLSARSASDERIARRRFALGIWGALALFVGSVMLGLIALRPTAVTLRRLAAHARRIGAGDLNVEPIVVPGRDEAAQLAVSFNEMSGTLRTLQFQLDALAEGRRDDPVLAQHVPGHIGQAMARSMTHLTEMTSRLRTSEQTARLAIDTTVEAIWTLQPDGTVLQANQAAAHLLGRPVTSMIGRPLTALLGEDARIFTRDGEVREVTDVDCTFVCDGVEIDALVSARRVDLGAGAANTMVFARDISERKRFEDELAWKASHDTLTGLPNRVALRTELASLAAACGPTDRVGVMFIDLDRFKRVNDGLGHRIGDDLLRQVAHRLRENLRADDVLARLGGDEFVVARIVRNGHDETENVGRRLIAALEVPFKFDGAVAHISASIGIVIADSDTDELDLIRSADVAMYAAKQSGRGRVARFDESMQGAVRGRVEMEEGLRSAIGNDELWPAFQPVVATADGALAGVEMLARWSLPGIGPVPPAQFIALAEETGVIVDIGIWALGRAAESAVAFRREIPTFDVAIAVNISSIHLMHGNLVDDVRSALSHAGARPEWLRLEITESYLLDEGLETVDETLRTLVDMGIGLSVDDFGTGYSSLTYLRRIPADVVKVDRSYVTALQHDSSAVAIIELVATLARNLGMQVVAEGVESEAQRLIVLQAGCELAQGFHFARPMSARELVRWVGERSPVPVAPRLSPVDSG